MKILKTILIAILLVFVLGTMAGTAMAGTPPMPPTPTPVPEAPSSGSSSAGYSAPASYTPPAFQPYTHDLKSSDGSMAGTLSGIDYSTVRLAASRTATVDGDLISVSLGADLNSEPASPTLDIAIGGSGSLPAGMDGAVTLAAVNISDQSAYGWSVKSGTPAVTFTVPASRLGAADADTKYYLVYYDGDDYRIITAGVVTDNGTATIEAKVPAVAGTYTAIMSGAAKPIAASSPTPAPVPSPAPVPCATPSPAPAGIIGKLSSAWMSMFGTFAIGEVAGAMILVTMGRFVK